MQCSKPVIALVHGACIGGGVDLIAAADVRIASCDARFSIKEVDIGLAADVGSLQRLPKVCVHDDVDLRLMVLARVCSCAMRHFMLTLCLLSRCGVVADHGK